MFFLVTQPAELKSHIKWMFRRIFILWIFRGILSMLETLQEGATRDDLFQNKFVSTRSLCAVSST